MSGLLERPIQPELHRRKDDVCGLDERRRVTGGEGDEEYGERWQPRGTRVPDEGQRHRGEFRYPICHVKNPYCDMQRYLMRGSRDPRQSRVSYSGIDDVMKSLLDII